MTCLYRINECLRRFSSGYVLMCCKHQSIATFIKGVKNSHDVIQNHVAAKKFSNRPI